MNKIDEWLKSGAGIREGLRLLSEIAPNKTIERLVNADPDKFGFLIERALKPFASGDLAISAKEVRKFRDDWDFLSKPDCPSELKILASDKITAYHNYVSAHRELSSCDTLDKCFETAKKVIENYRQNRKILSEFAYYKEHGVCLGKHPIFAESQRMSEMRSMNILQLMRMKKNLEGAIWRAKNEIAKRDKPHLDSEREARIESKTRQLREIERMINNYENDRY